MSKIVEPKGRDNSTPHPALPGNTTPSNLPKAGVPMGKGGK